MYYSWTWWEYKSESSEGLNISRLLSFVLKMISAGSSFSYIGQKQKPKQNMWNCVKERPHLQTGSKSWSTFVDHLVLSRDLSLDYSHLLFSLWVFAAILHFLEKKGKKSNIQLSDLQIVLGNN